MFGALHTRIRRAAVVLASTLVVIGSVVGLAAPAEAITNGKPTSPFSYPYYVRLRVYKYTSQFQYATCGGSLIDSQWILTAAHCMTEGAQKQSIGVQAWILDNCGVSAVELRIHPLRDGDWSNGHDLALVRIPNGTAHCVGPTGSQVYPKPVQVGDVSDTAAYAAGAAATIVGHGATSSGGKVTNELRYLWTSLRSDGDMSDVYDHIWSTNWNSRLMIGAGDSSHTACNGDSGGPLTVDRPQGTVEVGVASFDRTGCDEAAGFAKLAGPQQAWIAANVSDANIGGCSLNYGSIPGRWTATYSQSGSSTLIDGPFHYGFTCQRTYPTMSSASMSSAAAPMAPA
ncbi:MAG: trypsin-like serine protease [Acidimicrobiia bacterium]|nr:trypsin-like serine protease [Acidimicrobiia bacterium]